MNDSVIRTFDSGRENLFSLNNVRLCDNMDDLAGVQTQLFYMSMTCILPIWPYFNSESVGRETGKRERGRREKKRREEERKRENSISIDTFLNILLSSCRTAFSNGCAGIQSHPHSRLLSTSLLGVVQ
tara:strand:- start:80 stop:463 length:384 start_codon:yes stop_codon:yes gene_type:complete